MSYKCTVHYKDSIKKFFVQLLKKISINNNSKLLIVKNMKQRNEKRFKNGPLLAYLTSTPDSYL